MKYLYPKITALSILILLLFVTLIENKPKVQKAQAQTAQCVSMNRKYRLPITVTNTSTVAITDAVIETQINIDAIKEILALNATINVNSFKLIEGTNTAALPLQADLTSAAQKQLTFVLPGVTAASASRNLFLYFETGTGSWNDAVFTAPILVDGNFKDDENIDSIKITTPKGEWHYDKKGAGFSSFIDKANKDWLSYKAGSGSGGEYRGIPNTGYPEGYMHPGKVISTTNLLANGPVKATFTSTSNDGKWAGTWEVFPSHARLTMTKVSHPYWILYEGTPGGKLDLTTDFTVRSSTTNAAGIRQPASQSWNEDLNGNANGEWVYFEDSVLAKAFFTVNHTNDSALDSYWQMENNMTVFGFGRGVSGLTNYMNTVPQKFSFGLFDTTNQAANAKLVETFISTPTVAAGAPQNCTGITVTPTLTATPSMSPTPTVTTTPTMTSTPISNGLGDANGDKNVNILDYQILANNFGKGASTADFNKDGQTNVLDYQVLANNFGKTYS